MTTRTDELRARREREKLAPTRCPRCFDDDNLLATRSENDSLVQILWRCLSCGAWWRNQWPKPRPKAAKKGKAT